MAKQISAAVGLGGLNLAADVVTVQYLLNCVPAGEGGPEPELVLDGLIGPLTIGAINRFQKAQFGWQDGRVDPEHKGGRTIVRLNDYDPVPDSLPITPPQIPRLPLPRQVPGHIPGGRKRGKKRRKKG